MARLTVKLEHGISAEIILNERFSSMYFVRSQASSLRRCAFGELTLDLRIKT
jgi:hypothetical protein